jgi:hypothetical protein
MRGTREYAAHTAIYGVRPGLSIALGAGGKSPQPYRNVVNHPAADLGLELSIACATPLEELLNEGLFESLGTDEGPLPITMPSVVFDDLGYTTGGGEDAA